MPLPAWCAEKGISKVRPASKNGHPRTRIAPRRSWSNTPDPDRTPRRSGSLFCAIGILRDRLAGHRHLTARRMHPSEQSSRTLASISAAHARNAWRSREGIRMTLLRSTMLSVLAALIVSGAAVTSQAQRGDLIAFPADYTKGVLYQTVDRADLKQVRQLYASTPAAADAAK